MRELLFLGQQLAIVAGKAAILLGVLGIVWILMIAQAPGNLPGF